MAAPKWSDRLTTVVNLLVVAIVIGFLVRPEGAIGQRVVAYRQEAKVAAEITASWVELTKGARADTSAVTSRLLVLFSDYQCPACRDLHFQLAAMAREADASIVLRHMPLVGSHPMAFPAAKAAVCAHQQDRFVAMNDLLFRESEWQQRPMWQELALSAGVPDTVAFRECFESSSVRAEIERDLALAQRLGARGTPTFVGPRGMHLGTPSRDALLRLLE